MPKKYINDYMNFIIALKNGKTIHDSKTGIKTFMIQDVIVGSYEDGDFVVGETIPFQSRADNDRFYVVDGPECEIEIGKYYVSKTGEKFLCCWIVNDKDEDGYEEKMYIFVSQKDGKIARAKYDDKGQTIFADVEIVGEYK